MFDTMALERNISVSLRHFLLIALLILIILAVSSDYGVNGNDEQLKPQDKGVLGATGSNSVQGHTHPAPKRKKSKTVNASSSSLLGPTVVKAGNLKPTATVLEHEPSKSSGADSDNKEDAGHLKGPIGNPHAGKGDSKELTSSDAEKKEKKEDKTENKELTSSDAEKKEKKEDKMENKDEKGTLSKKPHETGGSSQEVEASEAAYEDEEDHNDEGQDSAEIQFNPSENIIAESEKSQLRKKPPTEDVSSASNFMTYFVVAAIVVIIAYLIFHNKKKLMAYIVEGRNMNRGRRQRPPSGAEYKPLKNAEEASGSRPEDG